MNTRNTLGNTAPDARDFLGGNYLRKDDVQGEVLVTLEDIREEEVLGSRRLKLVAYFREFEKPLILNKTNIRALAHLFQTSDTAQWRGKVSLYIDEAVEYGGERVGGIRVEPVPMRAEGPEGARNGRAVWKPAA